MATTHPAGHTLGVLYTGWLEKKNPVNGHYKQRFVVLTSEAIHWFKRAETAGLDAFSNLHLLV